jgi:esterase/lipase superfamily enzyme
MSRWIRVARPGQPLNIVYLTWPSDGAFTGLFQYDILMLGRRSAFNGFYLAQFISTLPKETPICLIGHSHGARMVSSAMHLLGGGTVQGYRFCKPGDCSHRIRVVLLAAAIDHTIG